MEQLYQCAGSSEQSEVVSRLLRAPVGSVLLRQPASKPSQRVLSFRSAEGPVRNVLLRVGADGWSAGELGPFATLLELLYALAAIIHGGLRLASATALAAEQLAAVHHSAAPVADPLHVHATVDERAELLREKDALRARIDALKIELAAKDDAVGQARQKLRELHHAATATDLTTSSAVG